jgi:hypothetical protein
VLLSNAPDGFHDALKLGPTLLAKLDSRNRVYSIDHQPDRPAALIIPLDAHFLIRIASAIGAWRVITGKTAGPAPRRLGLTSRHRKRLMQMLRALDGRLSEATYREIAASILDPESSDEPAWKTHPVRGQTIRLVKDALAMMQRGYLRLLRGR